MSERAQAIMETFKKVIPTMTEMEQEKLLSFGEGMAFVKDNKEEAKKPEAESVIT